MQERKKNNNTHGKESENKKITKETKDEGGRGERTSRQG